MSLPSNQNEDNDLKQSIQSKIQELNNLGKKQGAATERAMLALYAADSLVEFHGPDDIIDGCLRFTAYKLYDVAKRLRPPLSFDKSRVTRNIYEKCKTNGKLVQVKNINGETFISITEKGKQFCEVKFSLQKPNKRTTTYEKEYGQSNKAETSSENQRIFLSFDEYAMRSDVKPLLKYERFLGREKELLKLRNFLNDDNKKIMIITGEGGIGKTRLTLEFVKQMENISENKWNIYFVNPYADFEVKSMDNKTLLILDDAREFREDPDRLIDFVLNFSYTINIKLLIIERPYFINRIENSIREKNFVPEIMPLEKGDINGFLNEYFPQFDRALCEKIERKCRDSFVYAEAYTEYYKEEGTLDTIEKILEWKTQRYMNDIAKATGCNIRDIIHIINLVSISMPIHLDKDREYIMLELGSKYNVLEKIVYDVRSGYNYGLFLVEDSATVLIRPDPVADFLRFKAFRNNDGKVILERFIQYMPLRISQNAAALLSFDLKNNDIAFRVIAEVWQIINCILTVNSFCFLSYFRKTH